MSSVLPNGNPRPPESPASVLAISATFTAEPLDEALRFWNGELGLNLTFKFAPYNQVFQQLLDPNGLLATNRGGVNCLLVRMEDWAGTDDVRTLQENVRQFISSVHVAVKTFPAPFLICLCPPSPQFLSNANRAAAAVQFEAEIVAGVQGLSTVHVVTNVELRALYPVEDYYDLRSDELGHIPYTPLMFAALATVLMRKTYAMRATPHKVITLDCDETLWQGICGEDGPGGVTIDPPRKALQQFMLAQSNAGMLLALCSKNNEEDVLETFRVHPEMPLTLDNFVARRINWDPKPGNLMALADELELGLDTFILVDDNAKECGEVQAHCPEVLTVLLPANVDDIPEFLRHIWAFDHLRTTEEDRRRTALYAQKLERGKLEKQALNLKDFIAALQLEVSIRPAAAEQIPRVAQLTQRTNQMNTSMRRRSEIEIHELLRNGHECLIVDVSDRFGSYGLTGVMVLKPENHSLCVDTFLLSCRALGRGVEHRMLARIGEAARMRGLSSVEFPFESAPRNKPALLFLRSVASQYETAVENGSVFHLPADYAAQVEHDSNTPYSTSGPAKSEAVSMKVRPRINYLRIAKELRTPEQILAAIQLRRQIASRAARHVDSPRTELERQLVSIWSDLLNNRSIGIHDNFFDLGGHSLLAVQLLSVVQKTFGADLSLKIVYSGDFTVAELAKAIELYQIQQTNTGEYESLLHELEGLSDEEVAALLAEEQDGSQSGSSQ